MVPASSSRISDATGTGVPCARSCTKRSVASEPSSSEASQTGVRRFNTGDGQKLGGTDDDLVSLGPGLEDVAGATVGGRRSDAQAFALSDRVVPVALVAAEHLSVGGDDLTLRGTR